MGVMGELMNVLNFFFFYTHKMLLDGIFCKYRPCVKLVIWLYIHTAFKAWASKKSLSWRKVDFSKVIQVLWKPCVKLQQVNTLWITVHVWRRGLLKLMQNFRASCATHVGEQISCLRCKLREKKAALNWKQKGSGDDHPATSTFVPTMQMCKTAQEERKYFTLWSRK